MAKILAPVAKVFTFANKKLKQTNNANSFLVLLSGPWDGKCNELKLKFLWLHGMPASGGVLRAER